MTDPTAETLTTAKQMLEQQVHPVTLSCVVNYKTNVHTIQIKLFFKEFKGNIIILWQSNELNWDIDTVFHQNLYVLF